MIQLGISAFYHDSAACIVKDGKVLYAIEEERFTDIKHDSSFPENAIQYILYEANIIDMNQVDEVCWYENTHLKNNRVIDIFNKRYFKTFWNRIKFIFQARKKVNPEHWLRHKWGYNGKITYIDHHLSHSAFSYLTSPYKDAAILTIDGVGEWETVTISKGTGNNIDKKLSIDFPHSLGMLYSTITAFLGFKPNEGEYKVMGLAPYGDPKKYYDKLMSIFYPSSNKFWINQKYFTWEYSDKIMFNIHFCRLLGLSPRLTEEEITQDHKDLAAACQKVYETIFMKLVYTAKNITGSKNLVLGGGCAYNGVANTRAYKYFDKVYIPYAPSDAGSAIGACLASYKGSRKDNSSPFLGPKFADYEIDNTTHKYRDKIEVLYFTDKKLTKTVAELLRSGNVIAWCQDRMEFGARALGNRSILASPYFMGMKDKLNKVIKKREGFRPFAPSVLEEDAQKYFDNIQPIPYMNQVVQVKKLKRPMPAVTHVDNSARVQTVNKKFNLKYYNLLTEFKALEGAGVLLNTSFNMKGETITCDPDTAVRRFLTSEIDYLVFNNFLIKKK